MTICIALKVRDCIVFGADSATTISSMNAEGVSSVTNVWQHGVKMYNLYKGLPIIAMTCGAGNIGTQSISNVAKDFRQSITDSTSKTHVNPEKYTIEKIAGLAHVFFKERFEKAQLPTPNDQYFEFWIGGYDTGEETGEVWKICYQNNKLDEPTCTVPKTACGTVSWAGQVQVLQRLLLGYDPRIGGILKELGLDEGQVTTLTEHLQEALGTPLVCATMPVIDAIQLTRYLVNVTKGYFKYLPGADVVGGDTEIATVTKHEGFKWINRKHYYPAELNLKDTDHV